MKTEKVYLVGVHPYCFRAGKKAEIIGLEYVQPSKQYDYRLAYKVSFDDGFIDWIALSEVELGNWEYVSDLNVHIGLLPIVNK